MRTVCTAIVLFVLPACSGQPYQTAEVEGTILWKKKPLKNVEVQFLPDVEQQTRGPRSTALTDEQGHYTLLFDDDQPGAVVGHHLIVLSEIVEETQRGRKGEGHGAGSREEPNTQTASRLHIPDQYNKATTTPLKREVQPGSQTIDLDLP
jgi:hypothetical protein